MAILITGGAGFVGSNLAKSLKAKYPTKKIIAFDNLHRKGSETNLDDFSELGIEFVKGDIRNPEDFDQLPDDIELLIEASAEPSVHAGQDGNVDYLLETNLWGTKHCLEFVRKRKVKMIFLSTSRVYSIPDLQNIKLVENDTRFDIDGANTARGLSPKGISEDFNTQNFRSLYGATKLCSEYLIQEYVHSFGLEAIINRCGVIAGPGQWGKVDQGVYTLWVARHYFKNGLQYTGFGGKGKQVRDIIHPSDLFDVIEIQTSDFSKFNGECFNIGGGLEVSTSLLELTKLCEEVTGNKIEMGSVPETAPVDMPLYVSDNSKFEKLTGFKPKKSLENIITDIHEWIKNNEAKVAPFFR